MLTKQKAIKVVQEIGLALIIGLSLVYAIYRQRVSEKFIKFPFLDFPIFVGEIAMAVCFLLLVLKLFLEYRNKSLRINWLYWGAAFVYGAWVVTMALTGYFKIGAFALRTAALFYYVLFAVMAFQFYRKDFFSKRVVLILVLGMTAFIVLDAVTLYCLIPFLLVLLFLFFSIDDKRIRMGGPVLLALVILLKFSGHTSIHRSHLAGTLGTLIFFLIFGLRYINKNNIVGKRLLVGFFIAAILGMYVFLDKNVRKSFDLQMLKAEYEHFDTYVKENTHLFIFRDVPPNLYQDDDVKYKRRPLTEEERVMRDDPFPDLAMVWPKGDSSRLRAENIFKFETKSGSIDTEEASRGLSRFMPKQQGRRISESMNQILFRVFIWRDMLKDMKADPYSFFVGVGFHKPQRSHTIEILGWGRQEWGRDGWIAPHNSFFNLIYRGGILGAMLIAGIIFLIIKMSADFGRLRLLTSGLLIGVLVYWFVIANFLYFLEVPHTAIPFWSFLGVVCAYWRDCVKKRPVP